MADSNDDWQGLHRSLHPLKSINCNTDVRGVTVVQESDGDLIVFGGGNCGSTVRYLSCQSTDDSLSYLRLIPKKIYHLRYINLLKMFLATYDGHFLALFNRGFDLIHTVNLKDDEITCLDINEDYEIYVCTKQKKLLTWKLNYSPSNPLIPGKSKKILLDGPANNMKFYSSSNSLLIFTSFSIYILNATNLEVFYAYSNVDQSITCAVISPKNKSNHDFLLVGIKTGAIKIYNNSSHSYVDTLNGHSAAVTGLAAHPSPPAVVSSSLDHTIRIWNYESKIQVYCVDCDCSVLGLCVDYPRVISFSQNKVTVWNIGRLDTYFAKIDCPDIIKIQRVDETTHERISPLAPRIMVVAKNGEVRLLSPVTGQVITILLPMFSQPLIKDILYSQKDQLIFMLLKSYTILVFDAKHNPCAARELWTFTIQDHRVTCFTLCHTKLSTGKVHSLLFGGQIDGEIILLYSTDGILNMTEKCLAHRGQVSTIVGSSDIMLPKTKRHMLASYGQDNCLCVWTMTVLEPSHKILLSLHLRLSQMEAVPERLLLVKGTVCYISQSHKLVLVKLPESPTIKSAGLFRSFSSKESNWHKSPVTGLVGCSTLGIAITSTIDGTLKTWKLSNNTLMSTLNMGVEISCVAIANRRLNLLISTKNILTMVPSHHYLPNTLNINVRKIFQLDVLEKLIPFNMDSEFWYGIGHVRTLPLNQVFRLHYIIKHNMGLRNFPSEKLRQSKTYVAPSAMKSFESIDVISKRYPLLLEQKVNLKLAFNHLHEFSASESVRVNSAAQLKRLCAKRKPESEGAISSNEPDLDADPFAAPLQNIEEEKEELTIQQSHPRHPPIDGYIPNSIYRLRFGNSAIKKLDTTVQEKSKQRHHTKYDWSFYKSKKTKRRLVHTKKRVKLFEINEETTQTERLQSAQLSVCRLSASTNNSDIKVATVSESSLYSIATSVRLLGLTDEEERILMFMLQPEDLDTGGPPHKRSSQNTPESDMSLKFSSRHQSSELKEHLSSELKDHLSLPSSGRRNTTSGRKVRFTPDLEHDSEKNEGGKKIAVLPFKEITQTETLQPDIHQLYDSLMEKLDNSDPADEDYSTVLGVVHKLRKSKTLTEEQQRTMGSPVKFLLDIISREEASIETETTHRDKSPELITSKTKKYSFVTPYNERHEERKSSVKTELPSVVVQLPKDDIQGTNNKAEDPILPQIKPKHREKRQPHNRYPHVPSPPPSPPALHLPSLEKRREHLDLRRQMHRQNFAAQQQQQPNHMPVFYAPGIKVKVVHESRFEAPAQAVPVIKKAKVRHVSAQRGSTPNYTWLENRHHQNIARRLNLTGMDLVRTFMNYPNAIQSSSEITNWLVRRKENLTQVHHIPLINNAYFLGSTERYETKKKSGGTLFDWKDIYQARACS